MSRSKDLPSMSMPTELVEFAFRFAQEVVTNTVLEVEPDDNDSSHSSDEDEEPLNLVNDDNDPFRDD